MMEVLLRVWLKSNINQSLRRDSPTKFLLMFQGIARIGYLTLSLKGEKGGVSQSEKLHFAKCGKTPMCKCLVGTNNCFGCEKSRHLVKDCPITKNQRRESNQEQTSGLNSYASKKNRFYDLKSLGDQED